MFGRWTSRTVADGRVLQDLAWCTLCIGVRATLGGPRDGREITHPTAPDLIVLGYEDIIGVPHRLTGPMRGGVFAVKGARHGL
jgi:hypothetical protein